MTFSCQQNDIIDIPLKIDQMNCLIVASHVTCAENALHPETLLMMDLAKLRVSYIFFSVSKKKHFHVFLENRQQ